MDTDLDTSPMYTNAMLERFAFLQAAAMAVQEGLATREEFIKHVAENYVDITQH